MTALFDAVRQDLKYAFGQLRRSPGFATVAICSLAIGIGANVTIYSAAHAALRREPDAVRPAELVRVYRGDHSPLPRDWFVQFSRESKTMTAMIAEDPMAVGFDRDGNSERITASVVSENFFRMLGVGAAIGTVFVGEPGESVGQSVVLSHRYWTVHLGADPTIVGRTIRLNNQPFTVLGVARKDFLSSQFTWAPDVFVPMSEQPRLRGVDAASLSQSSFYITGRLAHGRTAAQAESEILAMARTLPGTRPELSQRGSFQVQSARGLTAEVRTPATIVSIFLMGVVGIVLLIACANLANLLLARAAGRRREIAIRTALGVSRARLIRQLLTESVLISTIGGAAGLAVALYITNLLPGFIPQDAGFGVSLAPDFNVLLFAGALALATGVIFGLAPALQASRADVQSMLRSEGAGGGSRRSKLRSAFLIAQVSLATLLLVTSALFLKSLGAAQQIDPGFTSTRVADLSIDLSLRQYDAARGRTFYAEVLDRVRSLSVVQSATLIGTVPLSGSISESGVALSSADTTDRRSFHSTIFTPVASGYFEMFNIPIVRGRAFGQADRDGAPDVVVINESLARALWSDADPIGQTIRFRGGAPRTVVGVARDSKYKSLSDHNVSVLYLPSAQSYSPGMILQVRLANDAPAERAAIRAAVQAIDPALPLPVVTSMADDTRIALLPSQLGAGLLGGFGALALFLAAIGVYGVTAYLVGQRTAEVGIRAALGASPLSVLTLMMRETVVLVGVGLALGIAGGIGVGVVTSQWLYGIGAADPAAIGGASALLLVVAMLGTWLPARRALRIDPIRALRSE